MSSSVLETLELHELYKRKDNLLRQIELVNNEIQKRNVNNSTNLCTQNFNKDNEEAIEAIEAIKVIKEIDPIKELSPIKSSIYIMNLSEPIVDKELFSRTNAKENIPKKIIIKPDILHKINMFQEIVKDNTLQNSTLDIKKKIIIRINKI
jgi:hypothetical protein